MFQPDSVTAPASWPQRVLMGLVRDYRFLLSPWLGSSCRFEPTCSAYSLRALGQHGAAWGTYLTLRRVGRCHPWCVGGHDPVPVTPSFGRLGTWLSRVVRLSNGTGTLPVPPSSLTSRKKTLP